MNKHIEEVYNPLVYIFGAIAVSSISYAVFHESKFMAFFISICFLIFVYCVHGIKFTGYLCLFLAASLYINNSYYNFNKPVSSVKLRIVSQNTFNTVVRLEGRNFNLDISEIEKNNENNANNGNTVSSKLTGYEAEEVLDLKAENNYIASGIIKNENKNYEKGIAGTLKVSEIKQGRDDYISLLSRFRKNLYYKLKENIGGEKSGLIYAMAFGDKSELYDSTNQDIKEYGLVHVVCVSGLHIALVYSFLNMILRKKESLIITFIYVIFTGAGYAAIRAFLMILSAEGGKIFHRNNNSVSALSLSGIILLIWKPYGIMEASFHLSYLATLGIILFNRFFDDKFYKLPEKIRGSMAVMISAQIFTLPYIMISFHDFSLNLIIGNLILMPVIEMIVILGNILIPVYLIMNIFVDFSVIKFWTGNLFDFLSYICMYAVKILIKLMNFLDDYTLPMFYGNEYHMLMYCMLAISGYCIYKGHKKFKYMPAAALLVTVLCIYSPVKTLRYYDDGAILISCRGDRVLVTAKNDLDMERMKKITFAREAFKIKKELNYKNDIIIKKSSGNYILKIKNTGEVLLKTSYYGNDKDLKKYAIIDCRDSIIRKIYLINDKIYV